MKATELKVCCMGPMAARPANDAWTKVTEIDFCIKKHWHVNLNNLSADAREACTAGLNRNVKAYKVYARQQNTTMVQSGHQGTKKGSCNTSASSESLGI